MKKSTVQTTLHIATNVKEQFKKSVEQQNMSMSDVVQELMISWTRSHSSDPGNQRVQVEHAAKILAEAVFAQLSDNRQWAMEALIQAGMGLPGSTVFDRRVGHFSLEKQELGSCFSRWLLKRIIHFLKQRRKVFLICDSGTTIFWFLKAFGEVISEEFKKLDADTCAMLKNVTLVTNNIPGAEAFVTYAAHNRISSTVDQPIADLVDCRLLAGVFLPAYVAVTGPDTNRDLETFCNQMKKTHPSAIFIGLATGNWVTLVASKQVVVPHLLARGRGHAAFKKTLLDMSSEIFVLAPLGKVLLESVKDLNTALGYTSNAIDLQKRSYEAVPVPEGKPSAIKLVSTERTKKSVLLMHSALVGKALKNSASILDYAHAEMPIGKVPHLIYPFDRFADEPSETQLEIELPHAHTRTVKFKNMFFSIK